MRSGVFFFLPRILGSIGVYWRLSLGGWVLWAVAVAVVGSGQWRCNGRPCRCPFFFLLGWELPTRLDHASWSPPVACPRNLHSSTEHQKTVRTAIAGNYSYELHARTPSQLARGLQLAVTLLCT